MSTNATRVVLADDLMREGLAGLFERSGFEVVGQSGNAAELLDLVRELRSDLVIVDIRMPPTHTTENLEAAKTIREGFPDIAVVALSAHVHVERASDNAPRTRSDVWPSICSWSPPHDRNASLRAGHAVSG